MDYSEKKHHYKRKDIADSYDHLRFEDGRTGRNSRKIRAIKKAMRLIDSPGLLLDMPAGTGRFYEYFRESGIKFVGADISTEMLKMGKDKLQGTKALGLSAADAEKLPFRDKSFDVVMSIRFLFHVPSDIRVDMIREMARVSKRYLILDYRLNFSLRNLKRWLFHTLFSGKPLRGKVSKKQMMKELQLSGVQVVAIFPVTRLFSDKHIVLCSVDGVGAGS